MESQDLMTINLQDNERIDDLQIKGYKIIQDKTAFCFGMDAVLLSDFAVVKKNEKVLDMCTGTGIVPILLAAKTEGGEFAGLEIQEKMAKMAGRSVVLNGLEEKIKITCGDVKEATNIYGRNSFEVITCNPPYMNQNHGLKNPDEPKAIARHEVLMSFEDLASQSYSILKPGGRLYLVHRPHRLSELIATLKKHRLEPKRLRFVHPFLYEAANMVLIEAFKDGKEQMRIDSPIIVYSEPGVYTKQIYDIYGYEDNQ